MTLGRCVGILLAAGAGTRYGHPKVLAEQGAWLRGAVAALRDGGCEQVYVVLGATGPAHRLPPTASPTTPSPVWQVSRTHSIPVPPGAQPVWASDWESGMGASLRAGLAAVIGNAAHPPASNRLDADASATADRTASNQQQAEISSAVHPTAAPPREADTRAAAGPTAIYPEVDASSGARPTASNPQEADASFRAHPSAASPQGTDSRAAADGQGWSNSPRYEGDPDRAAESSTAPCASAMTAGLPEFVAIMPVDTPDVGAAVVARVVAAARGAESGLARAVFEGRPGHPVVVGRAHWAGVYASLTGKSGAISYLRERADMVCVTCDDVATGRDHDYPRHAHTPSGS
ncbi:NTP transferase domain-containing protein [Nocardia sp. NPDC050406]|uniref:NTP transferase domain-containing protein n=1 Tax=Nocardia sp. NPDC050406 TaxID=3364318 RepID=UPI0037AAFFE4